MNGIKTTWQNRLALLVLALVAFAPLMLRLWRFATCGSSCGADSLLGIFSDTLTGCAFFALVLVCPRLLRLIPLLLWALFQVGSLELFQALQRYPVWQDLHYLFDADFVRNSTGNFRLAAPIFSAIICIVSLVAAFVRLPRVRLQHLVWSVPALAVLFFVHARLEAGSNHTVTANRNPVHNFVLDAAQGSRKSADVSTTIALSESLRQADLSGTSLLGDTTGKAKNVLIVVIEGIPGLYIPEIRKKMGVDEYEVTMDKLDKSTQGAMLIPDFTAHSHQTIRGLYAILCGDFSKFSWDTPKAFELLNMPDRAAACLPAQLAQHGFSTHFLQAAGLGFMAKDRVMATIGFNEVHGMEWFAEQKISNPFPFDWGIVDSAFFQGAQRYISNLKQSEKPWMLTLLTVGTHQPFGVPNDIAARYSSPRDAAVALLDEAVANFLDKLKADGTLDDTLVIVTSDESHGSPRWDWASSWSIHMVLAPESANLPRIKQGSYGLLDVEASVLDYLQLPLPSQIIGRSYFRNYDTPREMLSFTNMVLRRHSGDITIKCAGGHTCVSGKASSLITQQHENSQQLSREQSDETYAVAAALDNSLRAENDTRQLSFASGELRKIKHSKDSGSNSEVLLGGNNLDISANSDVTVHLQITLLEGPEAGVPFRLLAKEDRHTLSYMFDKSALPVFPQLPTLRPGESMDKTFSFKIEQNVNQFTFDLQADASEGLVRIDRFDVSIQKQPQGTAVNEENLSELDIAAQLGNAENVRSLIESGADINATNKHGITALMRATVGGHADIVTLLLDNRADPNIVNVRAETALSIALKSSHQDIAEILIKNGADPSAALIPISWHGRVPLAEFLLERGANINHMGGIKSRWTPLMHAAYHGHNDLVRFLLDKGADVNAVNNNKGSALSIALARNHTDIAEVLLAKGAEPNAALLRFAWNGNLNAVRLLLEHGANINHIGGIETQWTPLMHASYHGHTDMVKLLLEKGANVNVMDDKLETALSIALKKKCADIAEILLNKGASSELAFKSIAIKSLLKHPKIGKGQTPLMQAAYYGRKDLVPFLLDKGTDVNALTSTMESALSIALKRGHTDIAETLLVRGANVNAALLPSAWQAQVDAIQFLLAHGADINYAGGIGIQWTPLMHAAYHGHKKLVEFLLENGANVNTTTGAMETALSLALGNNWEDIARILLDNGANPNMALMPVAWTGNLDAAIFLLEQGANVNHASGIGVVWTPLMHAAYHGHKPLVIFLLDEGAHVNASDAAGVTALKLATDRGHEDIVHILKAAGGV